MVIMTLYLLCSYGQLARHVVYMSTDNNDPLPTL